MRTTHRPESNALTPPGVERAARTPAREPHSQEPTHMPAVTRAMGLLHRSAAAPSGFMSAEERAYLERRRYGCD
ncbi:MAG TPA: hypothetical protein VF761_06165 [Gemmatimonadaceae bacterium]